MRLFTIKYFNRLTALVFSFLFLFVCLFYYNYIYKILNQKSQVPSKVLMSLANFGKFCD